MAEIIKTSFVLKNSRMNTKLISSNPTLNFLLSTPIKNVQSHQSSDVLSGQKPTRIILNPSRQLENSSALKFETISFYDEIKKMMHSFGDVRQPIAESVKLIENIVQHQMIMLILEAESIAAKRNSHQISMEDFCFLLRHDFDKLAKLIKYVSFKDLKLKFIATLTSSESNECERWNDKTTNQNNPKAKRDIALKSKNEIDAGCVEDGMDDDEDKFLFDSSNKDQFKHLNIIRNSLSNINFTPEDLKCILDHKFIDKYTLRRNLRLDRFTKSMSIKDYLYYQTCRSITFFGSSTGNHTIALSAFQRFRDWILKEPNYRLDNTLKLQPDILGWEIIQYLAYDTVAILVELSLLVLKDQARQFNCGFETHRPIFSNNHKTTLIPDNYRENLNPSKDGIFLNNSNRKTVTKESTEEYLCDRLGDTDKQNRINQEDYEIFFKDTFGIRPENIIEVMRRFDLISNPLNKFTRNFSGNKRQNNRHRLLCLRC